MTRKEYLDGKFTHAEYYESVAADAGISFDNSPMLPEIRAALAAEDEHLNNIPLARWDAMAFAAEPSIRAALKKYESGYSLSDGVCTLKAAAKKSARKSAN